MRELIGLFGFIPIAAILGFAALLLLLAGRASEDVAGEATTAAGTGAGCGLMTLFSVLALVAVLALGAALVSTLPEPGTQRTVNGAAPVGDHQPSQAIGTPQPQGAQPQWSDAYWQAKAATRQARGAQYRP